MPKENLFDNDKILKIAAQQSAIDLNCRPEDFFAEKPRFAVSKKNRGARTYLDLPFDLNFCSYGANVVVSGKEEVLAAVKPIVEKTASHYRLFETPNMRLVDEAVQNFGCKICFMAEYFLPDENRLSALPCDYEIRVLKPIDFSDCTVRLGRTRCVRKGNNTTRLRAARMTAKNSWDSQALPRTPTRCGKSASTFSPNTGEKASLPRLRRGLRSRVLNGEKFRFTVRLGRIYVPSETL